MLFTLKVYITLSILYTTNATLLYPKIKYNKLINALKLPSYISKSSFSSEFSIGLSIVKYFFMLHNDSQLEIKHVISLYNENIIKSSSISDILTYFQFYGYCVESREKYEYDYTLPNPYVNFIECVSNFKLNVIKRKLYFDDFYSTVKTTKGLIVMRSYVFDLNLKKREYTTVVLVKLVLFVQNDIFKIYVGWFIDAKGTVKSFFLNFFTNDKMEQERRELYGFYNDWYVVE